MDPLKGLSFVSGENRTMRADDKMSETKAEKKAWTKPSLKYVGHVGDVLQGGGGKLTPAPSDPGESRKPGGQG